MKTGEMPAGIVGTQPGMVVKPAGAALLTNTGCGIALPVVPKVLDGSVDGMPDIAGAACCCCCCCCERSRLGYSCGCCCR